MSGTTVYKMRVHPSLLGLVVEIVKIHTDERIYNNPSEWGSPYAKPFLIIFDKSLVMDFKQNKSTGVLWVLNGFDGFIFFLKMFWIVLVMLCLFSIWIFLWFSLVCIPLEHPYRPAFCSLLFCSFPDGSTTWKAGKRDWNLLEVYKMGCLGQLSTK